MKVGLISGHGAGDCGACGYGYEEANETVRIVKMLDERLQDCGIETVVYPYGRNAFKDCNRGLGLQVDFSDCDYVVEVHLNSGRGDETGDDSIGGTEIYVTPREATTGTENLILQNMEELGYRNRGVKTENFLVINKVKNLGVSSALLETCFVDDVDDMELYENRFNETISAIARGICVGFGVGYTEEDTDDSTDEPEESADCMSREEKEYYVNCTYLELLGRLADSDGLENYVNAIPDDATWDSNLYEYVDANIKQSEEYAQYQLRQYIYKVYNAELGRNPDEDGMENYMGYSRYRDIYRDIHNSNEAKARRGE
jgi:hypothetical protein